jgi:hypothetical protein
MFEIVRYTPERAGEWNAFVAESKNGTFLFDRNYMDYHSDRFADHSLMFFYKENIYALLPAHQQDDSLMTHMGLTYGGLIMSSKCTVAMVMTLFDELNDYLRHHGIRHVLYKCVPWIYHRMPAEEDLYAMFRKCNPRLVARDFGSVIPQGNTIRWERIRRRALKRAVEAGITVEQSNDYAAFWQVLSDNLMQKYGVKPVHTLEEMLLLRDRFPENIVLWNAVKDSQVVAGIVVYITPQVVHAQYSSATPEGKRLGAIDAIYDRIINHEYAGYPYFDFGRSTEDRGSYLNEELIFQKEGFGARGMCWDWYEWDV